jgi:DNA-binding CsgD family transcriptional regulator
MGAPTVSGTDPLAAGRAALGRADWAGAQAHFEDAVAADAGPEALEGLSYAEWWLGDEDATLAARERAYRAYRQAGDAVGAARMAMWLGSDNLDFRGDDAVASAWLRTGRALLDGHEPCAELGYITLLEADVALLAASDPATAERGARAALELARQIHDPGVEVVAHALLGWALIASGDAEDGLRRLDAAGALAVGAEFAEVSAPAWALCHTVSASVEVGDFARAEQWSRALHTWCADWQARQFFGICRTAYGCVLATNGDWASAEDELSSAVDDLSTTRPALALPTAVRLGELRARQGNLSAARALFEGALPLPQAVVALGELELAAGDPTAAAEAADRVLRRLGGDGSVLMRLPALELLVRARAAAGEPEAAAAAAAEVIAVTTRLATPYMRGRGELVRVEALLAAGDNDGARQAAEDAVDLFGESSAPYEAARSRVLLSHALKALGRPERAAAEAGAAREAFERLGARREARGPAADELTLREVEILRLVARGLSDAQVAERLFLSPHTVHRHVANIRTKLRTRSRAAAVAEATRLELL